MKLRLSLIADDDDEKCSLSVKAGGKSHALDRELSSCVVEVPAGAVVTIGGKRDPAAAKKPAARHKKER